MAVVAKIVFFKILPKARVTSAVIASTYHQPAAAPSLRISRSTSHLAKQMTRRVIPMWIRREEPAGMEEEAQDPGMRKWELLEMRITMSEGKDFVG